MTPASCWDAKSLDAQWPHIVQPGSCCVYGSQEPHWARCAGTLLGPNGTSDTAVH